MIRSTRRSTKKNSLALNGLMELNRLSLSYRIENPRVNCPTQRPARSPLLPHKTPPRTRVPLAPITGAGDAPTSSGAALERVSRMVSVLMRSMT